MENPFLKILENYNVQQATPKQPVITPEQVEMLKQLEQQEIDRVINQDPIAKMDLTPLMQIADHFGNNTTNLAKGYSAPTTKEEDILAARTAYAIPKDAQKDLNPLDNMSKLMGMAKNYHNITKPEKDTSQSNAMKDQKELRYTFQPIIDDIRSISQNVGKNYGSIASLNSLNEKAQRGEMTYNEMMSALSLFAKQVNQDAGALSETDIGRQVLMDFETLLAQVGQKITSSPMSVVSDAVKHQINSLVERGNQALKERINLELASSRESFKAAPHMRQYVEDGTLDSLYDKQVDVFLNTFKKNGKAQSGAPQSKPRATDGTTVYEFETMEDYEAAIKDGLKPVGK